MKIMIGIDTGVKTGFALAIDYKDGKGGQLKSISTLSITKAMNQVRLSVEKWGIENVKLFIEDARKRTWFGEADNRQLKSGAGTREGVGSVKRDAKIWEDWCKEEGYLYQMIHPAANPTKLKPDIFEKYTSWGKRTSEHGRDAAMMVFKRNAKF